MLILSISIKKILKPIRLYALFKYYYALIYCWRGQHVWMGSHMSQRGIQHICYL